MGSQCKTDCVAMVVERKWALEKIWPFRVFSIYFMGLHLKSLLLISLSAAQAKNQKKHFK